MHYVTAGTAEETVLLLHGWPQTWYAWRRVIPLLVNAGYRVVAPDLRGIGGTSRPADGYDSISVAGDIAELMVDHLGLRRFHLVGHDWGGPAAFALATINPAVVTTLAIVDVTLPGLGPDLSQGGRRWHHGFHMTPELPEALTDGREHIYLSWFYRTFSRQTDAVGEADMAEYLRSYAKPGALSASFAYYRSIPECIAANRALVEKGYRLPMPTLGIGGSCTEARGRLDEPAVSLRTVADDVTEAVIAGSGHLVPEEKPEELVAAILSFFVRKGSLHRPEKGVRHQARPDRSPTL